MRAAKRVTLVPPEQTGGGGEQDIESGSISVPLDTPSDRPANRPKDRIKEKIYDKPLRLIQVALQLALSGAYDQTLRIKDDSNNFISNTNIVDLLLKAMSPGKFLRGEDEFIALLARSNVDPDLLLNENMRVKLLQLKKQSSSTFPKEKPEITQTVIESRQPDKPNDVATALKKGNKRFIIVNDDGNEKQLELEPTRNFKRKLDSIDEKLNHKRKRFDLDDDDIDDDMIDQNKWHIDRD